MVVHCTDNFAKSYSCGTVGIARLWDIGQWIYWMQDGEEGTILTPVPALWVDSAGNSGNH